MQKGCIVFLIVFFCCLSISSKNFKGIVLDSDKMPIAYASVILQNDHDSIIAYAYTDNNGRFSFSLPDVSLSISVRCLGYKPFFKHYAELPNTLSIVLHDDVYELSDVTIKSNYFGVKEQGDTLLFSTQYFSTGAEQNIGDIIRKMPGMQVDATGKVKYQNMPIGVILIDGQDVLGNSSGMFINNLSADFAYEIELQKKYNDGDVANAYLQNNTLALNLKRKKEKGRWDGNIAGGYGYKNKYKTTNTLLYLNKFSLTGIITANNTGEVLLSPDDFFSNQQPLSSVLYSGGGITTTPVSDEEMSLFFIPNNEYKRVQEATNFNFTFTKNERYRGTLSAIYQHSNSEAEDKTTIRYFSNTHEHNDSLSNRSINKNHLLSLNMRNNWFVSDETTIKANTVFSYSKQDQQNSNILSQIQINNFAKTDILKLQQDFTLNQKIGEGILYTSLNVGYNNEKNANSFMYDGFKAPLSANNLWESDYVNHYTYANGVIGVNYPLYERKIYLQTEIEGQFKNTQRNTVQQDTNIQENLTNTTIAMYIGLKMNKLGVMNLSLGTNCAYDLISTNLNSIDKKPFFSFSPKITMALPFTMQRTLVLTSSLMNQPVEIEALLYNTRIKTYNYIRLPSQVKNVKYKYLLSDINYSFRNVHKRTFFSIMIFHVFMHNGAREHYFIDDFFNFYQYENGGNTHLLTTSIDLDKGIGYQPFKITFEPRYDFQAHKNKMTDKQIGEQNTEIYSSNLTIPFAFLSTYQSIPFNFEIKTTNNGMIQTLSKSSSKYVNHDHEASLKLIFRKNNFTSFIRSYWQGMFEKQHTIHLYDLDFNMAYKWRKWAFSIEGKNVLHLNGYEWFVQSVSSTQVSKTLYRKHSGYILASVKYQF